MSNEQKPLSEWARKRAAGKIRREALIKRREAYFDLLVSGYSVEQIAATTKKVRQRCVVRSDRPWPSASSTRRRTTRVSRSRG